MKHTFDFYEWLLHHPLMLLTTVLAVGLATSALLTLLIILTRPVY